MRRLVLCGLVALAGCSDGVAFKAPSVAPAPPAAPVDTAPEVEAVSPEAAQRYLSLLSPMLVGRVLKPEELAQVARDGRGAIAPIVEGWTGEPGLERTARQLIETKLASSGQRDGVDYALPGNLAAYMVREQLPLTTLLTAEFCVDGQGAKRACDTGAPFDAGVLTTRAFMIRRLGRFNLTRASTLMEVFACRHYPMETQLQPPLAKARLLPLFAAATAEEQTDPRAAGGFGNGDGCYACHSQFGPHAQVFVRFDSAGTWKQEATGLQDPEGELGRSFAGLMASHLQDPAEARSEASELFGQPVENLRGAALAVAAHPLFLECQVRNVLQWGLGLSSPTEVDTVLAQSLAASARSLSAAPTFQDLVLSVFADPVVVETTAKAMEAAP